MCGIAPIFVNSRAFCFKDINNIYKKNVFKKGVLEGQFIPFCYSKLASSSRISLQAAEEVEKRLFLAHKNCFIHIHKASFTRTIYTLPDKESAFALVNN